MFSCFHSVMCCRISYFQTRFSPLWFLTDFCVRVALIHNAAMPETVTVRSSDPDGKFQSKQPSQGESTQTGIFAGTLIGTNNNHRPSNVFIVLTILAEIYSSSRVYSIVWAELNMITRLVLNCRVIPMWKSVECIQAVESLKQACINYMHHMFVHL